MELGEKIRQARLEAGLSQKALCGDTITRNMLSMIESGKARPGMDTLMELAAKLGKPLGYFLEQAAVTSPNQQAMEQARAAFCRQDYQTAADALAGYQAPDGVFDPEKLLLAALCFTALGKAALEQGRTVHARSLLLQAEQAMEQCPYLSEELGRQLALLQFRADPERAQVLASRLPALDFELLLRARTAFDRGDMARCLALLGAMESALPEGSLLQGRAQMALGQFQQAAESLAAAEAALPRQCQPLLEVCYRELGDFRKAYLYACKQREGNG